MRYLLAISIGPVQEFIAAARRTADLKAGSDLLVEIARTIAVHLEQAGAQLIFPKDSATEPPNKLLCVVEGNPNSVAQDAKQAAQDVLNSKWEEMLSQLLPGVKNALKLDLAQSQLEQFLEFYTAWVPFEESNYQAARQEVERLLAGRKALREFAQTNSQQKIPKSPLDPSRDCVLELGQGFQVAKSAQGHPLWLKPRETLDAVSVLKRWLGHETSTGEFPSSSLMAFKSILPIVEETAKTDARVRDALEGLKSVVEDTPAGIDLGDLMFPNRLDEAITELENRHGSLPEPSRQRALTLIKYHRDHTLTGWRKTVLDVVNRKECPPYYAILIADGDQMGKMLGQIDDKERHQQFSEKVAQFSGCVQSIVQKYHGYLVYHGGDDVLALLPINGALKCAEELSHRFKSIMAELGLEASLSAGIAIVHHMDQLQSCLDWARAAEREAKKQRNSVAVALHTRGGEAMTVSTLWDGNQWNLYSLWDEWIKAFREGLSTGLPYELRHIAREALSTNLAGGTLHGEATRVVDRKERRNSSKPDIPKAIATPEELEQFAKLLIIARFLAGYPELPIRGGQQ